MARRRPDVLALGVVLAGVVIANAPYVVGAFVANPLGPKATLAAASTRGWLPGLNTIDPNTGFISQALSHRAMLSLLTGHIPWWNSLEGLGGPMLGEMQSAALFPFTLFTILSNGQLWEHLSLEFIAAWSSYLLLRRVSLSRVACVAAALAFGLNGTFSWLSHATVNPVAFLPLLILGIEYAYDAAVNGSGRGRGLWLIAIAGALSVYAGFPEVAYIDSLLAGAWLIWRGFCAGRACLRPLLVTFVLGAVAGGLLAVPVLVAWVGYLPYADVGGHVAGGFGSQHLAQQGLSGLLLPYVYGPIFAFDDPHLVIANWWGSVGGYIDVSLLLLALLGLLAGQVQRLLRGILAVWILLVFARIYGEPPILGRILGVLPGMDQVAFYRYAFPALEFAVIALGAFGIDALASERSVALRRIRVPALLALLGVAGAALLARPLEKQIGGTYGSHHVYWLCVAFAVAVVAGIAAACLLASSRMRRVLIAAILVLEAGVMFVLPELSAPRSVTVDMAPVNYLRSHIGNSRFFTFNPISPNYGSYFGLAELNIDDLPVPKRLQSYITSRLAPDALALTFVGWTNGPGEPTSPTPQQELIKYMGGYRAAAVKYVLSPAGQALPVNSDGLTLVSKTSTTWIYKLSGSQPYFTAGSSSCKLSRETRESLSISCPTSTTLLKRELYMRGWGATVDGHSVEVHSTPYDFQRIAIPAGTHTVSFQYLPPHENLTPIAVILGLMVLGAGTARRWRPRPQPNPAGMAHGDRGSAQG